MSYPLIRAGSEMMMHYHPPVIFFYENRCPESIEVSNLVVHPIDCLTLIPCNHHAHIVGKVYFEFRDFCFIFIYVFGCRYEFIL